MRNKKNAFRTRLSIKIRHLFEPLPKLGKPLERYIENIFFYRKIQVRSSLQGVKIDCFQSRVSENSTKKPSQSMHFFDEFSPFKGPRKKQCRHCTAKLDEKARISIFKKNEKSLNTYILRRFWENEGRSEIQEIISSMYFTMVLTTSRKNEHENYSFRGTPYVHLDGFFKPDVGVCVRAWKVRVKDHIFFFTPVQGGSLIMYRKGKHVHLMTGVGERSLALGVGPHKKKIPKIADAIWRGTQRKSTVHTRCRSL